MSGYDRWLEAPYTDREEPEDCPDCDGSGEETPGPGSGDCKTCCGEGYINPPTREEIAEVRAEREFDELHDEGRI